MLGHCGGIVAPAVSQQFLLFSAQAFLRLALFGFSCLKVTYKNVATLRTLCGNGDIGFSIGKQLAFAAPGAREAASKHLVHMKYLLLTEKRPPRETQTLCPGTRGGLAHIGIARLERIRLWSLTSVKLLEVSARLGRSQEKQR